MTGPDRSLAPEHAITDDTLGRLTIEFGAAGVVLGHDSAGQPVLLRVFRPEPFTIAFLGRWWAAQILVLRCLAHGATVAVDAIDTPQPAPAGVAVGLADWLRLDLAASGTGDRVWHHSGDLAGWPATEDRPLLRLRDLGATSPENPAAPRPWQTGLTVLTRPHPASVPLFTSAEVVIVQRLDRVDAELVGNALALPRDVTSRLPALEEEMVAVLGQGTAQFAWLAPTSVERLILGGRPADAAPTLGTGVGAESAAAGPSAARFTPTPPARPDPALRPDSAPRPGPAPRPDPPPIIPGPSGSRRTGRTPTPPAGSA